MRSDQQATVENAYKLLKSDPARADRLRVEWKKVTDLLAGYFVGLGMKGYEIHMVVERARYAMLRALLAGTPDRELWIHAMHAANKPAAPAPR